jgi:hypothetical protein
MIARRHPAHLCVVLLPEIVDGYGLQCRLEEKATHLTRWQYRREISDRIVLVVDAPTVPLHGSCERIALPHPGQCGQDHHGLAVRFIQRELGGILLG